MNIIADGVSHCDANARPNARLLLLTGGPGAGKTEVVGQAAVDAAKDGCKVLVACPTGVLVAAYKDKLQMTEAVFVETVHAAFKITRTQTSNTPPGRLRHFDLIIFDEVSQLDDQVWRQVRTALAELCPGPFAAFVGDFQQLQPITGQGALQSLLQDAASQKSLRHIELQQHPCARSKDPELLDFLRVIRVQQPERRQSFFKERRLPPELPAAVKAAAAIEACLSQENKDFQVTFLTVTNKGARDINLARLRQDFPQAAAELAAGNGLPGDPAAGGGRMIFEEDVRIRFTWTKRGALSMVPSG